MGELTVRLGDGVCAVKMRNNGFQSAARGRPIRRQANSTLDHLNQRPHRNLNEIRILRVLLALDELDRLR